ncbi:DUF4224 domain-containing protein [Thiohalophilus sp.]|uniref:DUF4224 domain-containing protein n=1 Tax=Thiohalophilus sp. TaxID=3028392 RepID=UPI002ACED879|nr:DUF4224 domain-containing protein [Thiohalophilus sp.]MDZ7804699.1 DUF4224 domain-containing protein [Thiohalophilus sp.]
MTSALLSEQELVELTGECTVPEQVSALLAMDIHFFINRHGDPRVSRAAANRPRKPQSMPDCYSQQIAEKIKADEMAYTKRMDAIRLATAAEAEPLEVTPNNFKWEYSPPPIAPDAPRILKDTAHHSRKRKKHIKLATPGWADKAEIRKVYRKAKTMTDRARRSGKKACYVVDHVIPITNELVCGLHVQDNLRIITARQNGIKHNKFEPI